MSFNLNYPPIISENRALSDWLLQVYNAIVQNQISTTVNLTAVSVGSGVVSSPLDKLVSQTTVTPATDGAETVFITPHTYRTNTLYVYRDQSLLIRGIDYTETTSTTFTMTDAPDSDEILRVSYIKI